MAEITNELGVEVAREEEVPRLVRLARAVLADFNEGGEFYGASLDTNDTRVQKLVASLELIGLTPGGTRLGRPVRHNYATNGASKHMNVIHPHLPLRPDVVDFAVEDIGPAKAAIIFSLSSERPVDAVSSLVYMQVLGVRPNPEGGFELFRHITCDSVASGQDGQTEEELYSSFQHVAIDDERAELFCDAVLKALETLGGPQTDRTLTPA